jgi:hypothetical protein
MRVDKCSETAIHLKPRRANNCAVPPKAKLKQKAPEILFRRKAAQALL